MDRRFRSLAALLALVAFSGYFAEGVLAVFCAPDSSQQAEIAMAAAHAPNGHAHGPAEHEAPADESHQSHCPFGMGGGMSCVAASLPGTVFAVDALPASSEGAFAPQQVTVVLLLVHSPYHPPRA
jgi:hypothetical protein